MLLYAEPDLTKKVRLGTDFLVNEKGWSLSAAREYLTLKLYPKFFPELFGEGAT